MSVQLTTASIAMTVPASIHQSLYRIEHWMA
jgi:hypothetical protein